MILDSTQQAKLKDYLLVTLETISEADNDALAEYILALLKNDKPQAQLQRECSEQLEEFLENHTKNFVSGLFLWLKKNDVQGTEAGDSMEDSPPINSEQPSDSNIPKQKAQELERDSNPKPSTQGQFPTESHEARHSSKIRSSTYNGKQPLEHYRPGRCPDFETRGFCVEGKNCRYTHEDAIPMDQQEVMNSHARNNSRFLDTLSTSQQDDYDPSDPYFGNQGSHYNNRQGVSASSRRSRGGFSHRGRGSDRDGYTRYQNSRPIRYNNKDQNNTNGTILSLVSIPKDKTLEDIKEYFGKFDEIVNVNLDRTSFKADIEFKTNEGANKAYTSPDPIFDNRFVKLFWKQTESSNKNSYYTPSYVNHSYSNNSVDFTDKTKKEALLRKKKADLLAKQLEEQKKLLALIESKSISEEDKKFLLKSMGQLSDSIKETLNSIADSKTSSAKKFKDSASSNPADNVVTSISGTTPAYSSGFTRNQPRLASNKWFPNQPEVTQTFRLDNRPTSFKILGFDAELQPTLETHLKSVRGVDTVTFNQEDSCFVVDCRNPYLAKRAQMDCSKFGDTNLQSTWIDKTDATNSDSSSIPAITNQ